MASVGVRETEWQFDAVDLPTVARALEGRLLDAADVQVGADRTVAHTDLYLDTEDHRLHRAGYALRIRRVGRRRVAEATLKSLKSSAAEPGPLDRREITQELEGADPEALLKTDGPVAERTRAVTGRKPLGPLFTIRTRRQSFSIASPTNGAKGVLSLDESTISPATGSGTTKLLRVEVEIDGADEKTFAPFVERLRAECGLQPATLSKYETALLVSDLRPTTAEKFGPTGIDPHTSTVGDAGLAVMRRHLAALVAHEPGTRLGEDPEELHDMRVASRRLRAALSLFAEVLAPSVRRAEDDLRWIGHTLGDVRDLDVQLGQLSGWLELSPEPDRAALEPLRKLLEEERASARERMLAALDSRRYESFIDRFARALRARRRGFGPWSVPVRAAAPDLIESRFRAVRKAGAQIGSASEATEYHRLRIRAKRLRYALEFFADAYPGETGPLIKRLVALQDALGRHQDAQVAIDRLRTLANDGSRPLEQATVFAMGEVAERYRQDMLSLRVRVPGAYAKVAGKSWRAFDKVMQRARPSDHPVGMTAGGTRAGSIEPADG
jgi:triphosphatase